MRKIFTLALTILFAVLPSLSVAATADTILTRGQLLTGYFSFLLPGDLPENDRPVLNFTDINNAPGLQIALQKAVAFGLLPNPKTALRPDIIATDRDLASLLRAHWGISLAATNTPLTVEKATSTLSLLGRLPGISALRVASLKTNSSSAITVGLDTPSSQDFALTKISNFYILDEEFRNIRASHYDSAAFSNEDLIYGAAKGMAEATKDKWAAFFPPAEAKEFQEALTGEYEGIGAYVDMETTGVFRIVSPISGSPAEKAGLLPGDQIIKIGDVAITDTTDLKSAVALIKGPAGTSVLLTILRGTTTLTFTVTRAKVTIKFVEDKPLSSDAYLIKITTFGFGSAVDFQAALDRMVAANPSRVILDLRNDPGGSLEEVSHMLSQLVPKNEPTVVIRYRDEKSIIDSTGSQKNYFAGRKVVVLINNGTASASEIMAGTLKDYYPTTLKIVGEKSYGKGSVQTQVMFNEGSSMKFTIAKWFTGKTETGIDGKGITPDLESKPAEKTSTGTVIPSATPPVDVQLEYAKTVQF